MSELYCEWSPDCQGKWDYDADLIQLSCRYWPAGGGFYSLDTSTGEGLKEEINSDIKPSAKASIMIQYGEVISEEFEADTEQEVKAMVEEWSKKQFILINDCVRSIYLKSTKELTA